MSVVIKHIPKDQRVAQAREQLSGYVSALYRLHIGIAKSQTREMMSLNDREAAADMYSQAQEMCRELENYFGFSK